MSTHNEQTKWREKNHEEIMNNLINTLRQSASSDACTSTSSSVYKQTLWLCIQANAFYTNCKIIILPAFFVAAAALVAGRYTRSSVDIVVRVVVFDFSPSKCNSTTSFLLLFIFLNWKSSSWFEIQIAQNSYAVSELNMKCICKVVCVVANHRMPQL